MNKTIVLILLFVIYTNVSGDATNHAHNHKAKETNIPFIANNGQFDFNVEFHVPLITGDVFITKDGKIVYHFADKNNNIPNVFNLTESLPHSYSKTISGVDKSYTNINFIKGNDEKNWVTKVPSYYSIRYEEAFEGIDMSIKAYAGGIEKLFYIHPGSDPDDIILSFVYADFVRINNQNQLEVGQNKCSITFTEPVAYQIDDEGYDYIDVKYVVSGNNYGFELGEYDPNKMLIIDPLIASTFIGGSGYDGSLSLNVDMVRDSEGNILIGGSTSSANFPMAGSSYNKTLDGESDIFIAKFSGDLNRLLVSTYIGGTESEELSALDIDDEGNIFITGFTTSADYPVSTDAFQKNYSGGVSNPQGSRDVFVTKLSSDCSSILASTYLGVDQDDCGNAIEIDSDGNVYVAGITRSRYFPMAAEGFHRLKYSYGTNFNNPDGFISKFDNSLTTLLASTYLGSGNDDYIETISIAADGSVYAGGNTRAPNIFTTPGAFQPFNNNDGYNYLENILFRFDSNLINLLICTYLGGGRNDYINDLCLDSEGNVYVTGYTESFNFPITVDAFDKSFGGGAYDAFISKLDPMLTQLLGSTYFGGNGEDIVNSIFVDQDNAIYVGGQTLSNDLPISENAYKKVFFNELMSSGDIFVSKFNNNLSALTASTYLGGVYDDTGRSITIDDQGNVIVAGSTFSADYPVTDDSYCEFLNWSYDVVVTILDSDLSAEPTSVIDEVELPKDEFVLYPNYPNPFNPSTNIQFYLGREMTISVVIYDITGKEVAHLADNELRSQGIHSLIWNAKNSNGMEFNSGTYFCNIKAEGYSKTIKLSLVR